MKDIKNEQLRRIIKSKNPQWALCYLKRHPQSKYQLELATIILVGTSITAINGFRRLRLVSDDLLKNRLYQLGCFL